MDGESQLQSFDSAVDAFVQQHHGTPRYHWPIQPQPAALAMRSNMSFSHKPIVAGPVVHRKRGCAPFPRNLIGQRHPSASESYPSRRATLLLLKDLTVKGKHDDSMWPMAVEARTPGRLRVPSRRCDPSRPRLFSRTVPDATGTTSTEGGQFPLLTCLLVY